MNNNSVGQLDKAGARAFLAGLDADWARLIAGVDLPDQPVQADQQPYAALIRAVAYQQLHARAAAAILQRLLALYPAGRFPTPQQLLATDPEQQRACGLSASKLLAIRGIAQAALAGELPTRAEAESMDDEALITCLTRLRGIGRWTAEMFLLDCLDRPDVFPADDLGIREGYRRLKQLDQAPNARTLRQLAQDWSPCRSLAARYLWRVPRVELPGLHHSAGCVKIPYP